MGLILIPINSPPALPFFTRVSVTKLCLTSFLMSSYPPMCMELKKIWGTVLRPVRSCISYRRSGYLSRLTSTKGTWRSVSIFLVRAQNGHPVMENSRT